MSVEYLNLIAIRGEVVIQFWLKPGDAPVELSFTGGDRTAAVPAVLRGLF